MSKIETLISPFIPQQFPSFYREDGPNFIAFVRAYYEWLEQTNNTIYHSRRLLDYADIDTTAAQFITYFKNTYLNELPDNLLSDKRLLTKHILELYRAKGTQRAYELLFRLLYNEDIEFYIPGNFIFKPSDNTWYQPNYIETSYSPYLNDLIGKDIYSSSGTGEAVVDNYTQKIVDGKNINVLYLSAVRGRFKFSDKILSRSLKYANGDVILTTSNAPRIIGSLTAVSIENGGYGFSVGDILDLYGKGVEGKARVASVRDENGKVNFTLVNGGTGYSINAVVTVAPTLVIGISGLTGDFANSDVVVDSSTSANGTCIFANNSVIKLINFSSNLSFTVGDTITSSNGSATVTSVAGGGGAGATFKVGGLTDTEIVYINTDLIQDYSSLTLETSVRATIGVTANTFTVGDTVTCNAYVLTMDVSYTNGTVANTETLSNTAQSITGLYVYKADNSYDGTGTLYCTGTSGNLQNANIGIGSVLASTGGATLIISGLSTVYTSNASGTVSASNTTSVTISSPTTQFIPRNILVNATNPNTANITAVTELSSWVFPYNPSANLNTPIYLTLNYYTSEVGTIAYLSSVNPGTGYSSDPYVDVIEPVIAALGISEIDSSIKGHNAVITAEAINAQGIVTAAEVIESGYGYIPNDRLTMTTANGEVSVTGSAIISLDGRGAGRWLNNKSFISDVIKIQDSYYYQDFSYEIISRKMLNVYETLVRDLVHPSGMALFGRFRLMDELTDNQSEAKQFSINQS